MQVCFNVVPKSALLLDEDEEFKMYRIFVLAKGAELVKSACKDRRYIVRVPDTGAAADVAGDKEKRATLESDRNSQLASLKKWCLTSYSELFVSWAHVKAIRIVVEAVLRYGLPVNFHAFALKVTACTPSPVFSRHVPLV